MSKRRILGSYKVPGHRWPWRALHQVSMVLFPSGFSAGITYRSSMDGTWTPEGSGWHNQSKSCINKGFGVYLLMSPYWFLSTSVLGWVPSPLPSPLEQWAKVGQMLQGCAFSSATPGGLKAQSCHYCAKTRPAKGVLTAQTMGSVPFPSQGGLLLLDPLPGCAALQTGI